MRFCFLLLSGWASICQPVLGAPEGGYDLQDSYRCHWFVCEEVEVFRDEGQYWVRLADWELPVRWANGVGFFGGSYLYTSSQLQEERYLSVQGMLTKDGQISLQFAGQEDYLGVIKSRWTVGWSRFRRYLP